MVKGKNEIFILLILYGLCSREFSGRFPCAFVIENEREREELISHSENNSENGRRTLSIGGHISLGGMGRKGGAKPEKPGKRPFIGLSFTQ